MASPVFGGHRSYLGTFLALVMASGLNSGAAAQGQFAIPVPVDAFPNFVAVGVGAAPDYIGSDDFFVGGAPAARLDLKIADLKVLGNWAMIDVLKGSNFSFGPAGILRFGRNNVEDEIVGLLPDIDLTVELGVGVGYEIVDSNDPLKRISFGADLLHDVGGVHDGFVGNLYARGTYPLWWSGAGIIGTLATTIVDDDYASTYFSVSPGESAVSGLPSFNAGAGARDVRTGVGFFQALSPNWLFATGLQYSRVLGDAGDSPIVDQRGSRNQFIFGAGVAYAWGADSKAD